MSGVWLVLPDRTRLPVSSSGVLLGRDPGADVQLTDPSASRHHALVRWAAGQAVIVSLGRHRTRVGDVEVQGSSVLANGDRIEVPGLTLVVEIRDADAPRWVVRTVEGPTVAVAGVPFRVGAGGAFAPPTWPADALRIDEVGRDVLRGQSGVRLRFRGVAREAGPVVLLAGETVGFGAVDISWDLEASRHAVTTAASADAAEVVLQMLPEGGRLLWRFGGAELGLWLPERRFALVSALLDQPDEFILDDALCARIWPRSNKGRVDLNVLIARARGDLAEAGLDPSVLERAKGGGGTRLRIPPRMRVRRV